MNLRSRNGWLLLCCVFLVVVSATAVAEPRIAIIIDDLGNLNSAGRRTAALDGPIACSILPHTPHAAPIAEECNDSGKEVLLHLPLQPIGQLADVSGAINLDTTRNQLAQILSHDILSVPHVVGVNNHMGSLLTQHPGHMTWLMQELANLGGLFFVDSYTTKASVALKIARESGLPAVRRNVFLDNEVTDAHIAREFARLVDLAKRNGFAVGIGHPYPATLDYLEQALPTLNDGGVKLVPISSLLNFSDPMVRHSNAQEPRLAGN